MRKPFSTAKNLIIFIIAQLFWLALVGLWIYWYVSNYLIFEKVGETVSPQINIQTPEVFPFVGGLILLVALSFTMVLIFRHLNLQIRLTSLYDNFIANITHELKSPLSSIQLYLETLRSRDVPSEKQKEFIEQMLRDTSRLQNLINSILEISALESKKQKTNFVVKPAAEFIPKVIKDAAANFRLADDTLIINTNGNNNILVDEHLIRMVFDNLIDNSIKYCTDNLKIQVNIDCKENQLEIDFRDNGIGIEPKEQKNIFKKFYRIYGDEIPNVKGTGLGLYWIKGIIKNHNGKISVISEGKGKGTTFRILLPVYKNKKLLKRSSAKED